MKTLCALAALLITGCLYSKANREGLDLSCAELQDGAANACAQGIITSCEFGVIQYRVCSDDTACEGTWQQQGRFRCDQMDAPPDLALTSGAGGATQDNLGSSGAGGSIANGSGGTASGSGGSLAMPSPAACSSTLCVAADADGYLSSLVADATNLYFVTGNSISVLSKAGGSAVELARTTCAASGIQLAVNSTDVYATCSAGSIVRISKVTGSIATVTSSADGPKYITADDDLVYWGESYSLQQYVPGGTPLAIPVSTSPGRILMADGYVYWSTPMGLSRIATEGGQTQTLQLGGNPKDFAVADGNIVALLDDSIVARSPADTTSSTLAEAPQGSALTVQGSHAYWTAVGTVNAVPLAGGDVTELASGTQTNDTPGSLVVDDTMIYWVGGTKVYKLARPW